MVSKIKFISISIVVLLFLMASACQEKEIDNSCKCFDNNGTLVLDTLYHMEYDQAYQLCEGKEGTQNITNCDCAKL